MNWNPALKNGRCNKSIPKWVNELPKVNFQVHQKFDKATNPFRIRFCSGHPTIFFLKKWHVHEIFSWHSTFWGCVFSPQSNICQERQSFEKNKHLGSSGLFSSWRSGTWACVSLALGQFTWDVIDATLLIHTVDGRNSGSFWMRDFYQFYHDCSTWMKYAVSPVLHDLPVLCIFDVQMFLEVHSCGFFGKNQSSSLQGTL